MGKEEGQQRTLLMGKCLSFCLTQTFNMDQSNWTPGPVVNKRACERLHSPTDFPSGGHPRVQFTISRTTFCPGRGVSIVVTPADPG